MYLSDREIIEAVQGGNLDITPFDEQYVNPNSIDLRLGNLYVVPPRHAFFRIDDPRGWRDTPGSLQYHEEFILEPGAFVLGTTQESVWFKAGVNDEYDLWGQIHGKSTFGRLGLMVHVTAGVIDTGFQGQITLELKNVGTHPLTLVAGVPICQLTIAKCGPVRTPYAGKYQGQEWATWAR